MMTVMAANAASSLVRSSSPLPSLLLRKRQEAVVARSLGVTRNSIGSSCGSRQKNVGLQRSFSSSLSTTTTTARPFFFFHTNHHRPNKNISSSCSNSTIFIRSFSYEPLTPQEEEAEKQRVAQLSAYAKEQELRQLNRDIARLELLRGINNGERYTWTGQYKLLARNYGMGLVAWYWACFSVSFVGCWTAISVFGIDAMQIIGQVDAFTGWSLQDKVDPTYGQIGLVLVMNELLEPLRLPIVIVTVKPVVDRLYPSQF